MKKVIRLTESELQGLIREALEELNQNTYTNYWQGRADQARGKRPLSNAMNRKGDQDLKTYTSQGYPCGGAKTGEQFGRMEQQTKVDQRNAAKSANVNDPTLGDGEYIKEMITRAIRKYLK